MFTLTQQLDTDRLVTEHLDDKSLLNLCRAAPDLSVCQDDNFWYRRTINKYGPIPKSIKKKSPNLCWKTFYLKLIYYMKNRHRNMYLAAKNGHRDLVVFFISQSANYRDCEFGLEGAASGGHLKLVELFIGKGARNFTDGMFSAAKGGHRHIIDFLSKRHGDWDHAMAGAAERGDRVLVDYCIERGADHWNMGMFHAAGAGHWDLADYFLSKGASKEATK